MNTPEEMRLDIAQLSELFASESKGFQGLCDFQVALFVIVARKVLIVTRKIVNTAMRLLRAQQHEPVWIWGW